LEIVFAHFLLRTTSDPCDGAPLGLKPTGGAVDNELEADGGEQRPRP
jgi:hypothetical protein